jgi:hypothetical protein
MKLRNKMIKALIGGELVFFLVCMLISQGTAQQIVPEFPIATTTGREMAVSAAFDGTNYLVGIEGDAYDRDNITGQLVSQSRTLVGSRISVGRTGGVPYVAFDGTNYLMVWEDDATEPNKHIYGQLIGKSGTLIGSPFLVSQGTGDERQFLSNIIFDGTNYFVVWDYAPIRDGCADEYGQFVTPSGTLLGQPIKINTTPCGGGGAAVAFDGTNILVSWGSEWNASGTQSVCWTDSSGYHCDIANIWGQFITKSSAGTPGTLSGSNFLISAASVLYSPPSIAFDGTNYLVIFAQETTRPDTCPSSGCKWDICGQLVTKAGAPIGSRITITDTSPNHFGPLPVFNGTNYLVTWTEGFGSTEATVKGRFFDKSGGPVGSEFALFSPSGGRVPWVAFTIFDGSKYFSVITRGTPGTDPNNVDTYTNQDVYGAFTNPLPLTQYTLTVTKAGTGGGTVKSSPAGINCGNDCSESYNEGTSVTLTATADAGSTFAGWSGAGCSGTESCSVTMNSNETITATFNQQPQQYTLTVTKSGTGSGTVKSSPAGINCGDDCSETYSKVQKVKLTAKADATSTFTGWSGGGCSGTKTCTVTVDAAVTVTADFALKMPDISVAQTCVDFGSMKVGKKVTKTLKIGNNGTGDLVITLSGLEGTDFRIQGSSSVIIKAKKSYSLKVLFMPKSAGLGIATLNINSDDPDTPKLEISLSGIGQ